MKNRLMKRNLLLSAVVCCLFSCAEDKIEEIPGGPEEEHAVIFAANITEYQTRISQDGDGWSKGDRIGAYMLSAADGKPVPAGENVLYSCTEAEQLAVFTSIEPLNLSEVDGSVRFMAYYPYAGTVDNQKYDIRLDNQEAGTAPYDLMYAVSDKTYSSETLGQDAVALNFVHGLSKVVLKFVDQAGKVLTADKVEFHGMNTSASFNLNNQELRQVEGQESFIRPYLSDEDKTASAIVFPATLTDAHIVKFTVGDAEYQWAFLTNSSKLTTLDAGFKYTFTIRVEQQSGEIDTPADVEESGSSSNPWGDGGTAAGIAGMVKYKVYPESENAFVDTELKISFEGEAPQLGNGGMIRIYRSDNPGQPIDEIDMSERQVAIQANGGTIFNTWMDIVGSSDRRLIVNYHPVRVEGNDLIIKPHSRMLDYDAAYYVTIDKEAVVHDDFQGISGSKWFFRTRKKVAGLTEVKVSHKDENADFYTIQGAVDYFTQENVTEHKTIVLGAETYDEIINIRNLSDLLIKGQGADKTIIQSDNNNDMNQGITDGCEVDLTENLKPGMEIPNDDSRGRTKGGGRAGVLIAGKADKIRFEDLSMKNTYPVKAQAEVLCLRNKDTNATAFVRCKFYGRQDTLLPGGGYNWFYQCYVEGDTDFIWGNNSACLFEQCEARMITGGGRAFNARIKLNNIGYVFYDCKLTVAAGVKNCRLMEGSGTAGYDNMTYVNTTIDKEFFSGGICDARTPLNPRPDNKIDGDTGVQDGCKMYNCTYIENGENKGSVVNSGAYGTEFIFELDETVFSAYFKDRSTILGGYADIEWFKE